MKTLLLIDGNAIMHRAYHALPPFKTKAGVPTNVVYGFFGMVHKAIQLLEPTHIAICFDTPAQTFRQKLLPAYQAQRPQISDDFIVQIPILKDLLDASHLFRCEQDGLEADDMIGTISHEANKSKMRTFILTGDKDIMQLVNENTFVVAPQTGLSSIKVYSIEEVQKKLGVLPQQIPELKALMGDPSDNYKGAKGVGPKTALKLIAKYGTIKNLLQKSDELDDESKKDVELSYKIATIVTDAPIDCDINNMVFNGFDEQFKQKLLELEMFSLIGRIYNAKQDAPLTYKSVKEKQDQAKELKKATDQIGLF